VKRIAPLLIALLLAAPLGAGCTRAAGGAARTEGNTAGYRIVDVTPMAGELGRVLADEAQKAKALGLRPFVEIGATWCAPCLKLKESLKHPKIVDALQGAYIIRLDLDAWNDQLPRVGLGTESVPVFFQLGTDGRPTGKRITGAAWNEDTPEGMAPPIKAFLRG